MKLLLTSAGITNNSIKSAMANLVNKKLEDCIISFIPTAGNVGNDDKDNEWEDEDIEGFRKTRAEVIIVDIEKFSKREWLPLLKKSDIICFGGGNTYHLLYWVRKSGLEKELKDLLGSKLYIGISAGSIIAGPDIKINRDIFPEEEGYSLDDLSGLKYVPFAVTPHFLSKLFPKSRKKEIEEFAKKVSYPVYAIDDNTAIKVIDNKLEVISEGKWEKYN
ncbi:MAG: Type 1 glutamine amidotransferase-like domain-containing protein [Candidatus Nealsonbacteria bacterium]